MWEDQISIIQIESQMKLFRNRWKVLKTKKSQREVYVKMIIYAFLGNTMICVSREFVFAEIHSRACEKLLRLVSNDTGAGVSLCKEAKSG